MDAKLTSLGLDWLPSLMGVIFLLAVASLIYLVIRFARRKQYLYAVLAVLPLLWLLKFPVMDYQERREYMAKYEPAKAIFDKLCKEQSQPIIKRTVQDVEGVLLLKVRAAAAGNFHQRLADQMWADAALAVERTGDEYIKAFLLDRGFIQDGSPPVRVWHMPYDVGGNLSRGFRFVDVENGDGTSARISATLNQALSSNNSDRVLLQKVPSQGPRLRYAIDFENNVDPELRKHWIAGTTVQVVDLQLNEVIGQQTIWSWDQGFGNTNQRSPWSTNPAACPANIGGGYQTHSFVEQVIKAKQGN